MEERSVNAALLHNERGDLIVPRFTIAGASTKMQGIGATTTTIFSNHIPAALPATAEGDIGDVHRTVSMEEELIQAHTHPEISTALLLIGIST